jgi:hypothetical protein
MSGGSSELTKTIISFVQLPRQSGLLFFLMVQGRKKNLTIESDHEDSEDDTMENDQHPVPTKMTFGQKRAPHAPRPTLKQKKLGSLFTFNLFLFD